MTTAGIKCAAESPSPPLLSICRVPRSRALSIARRVNALQGINASDITSRVIFRGLSCMCTRALCARMRYIRNVRLLFYLSVAFVRRVANSHWRTVFRDYAFALADWILRPNVRETEYNRSPIAVTRRPSPWHPDIIASVQIDISGICRRCCRCCHRLAFPSTRGVEHVMMRHDD